MEIEVSKESTDIDFIEDLIERLKTQLRDTVDSKSADVSAWDKYVNSNSDIFSNKDTVIDVRAILLTGIENLTYAQTTKNFIIKIKENVYIKNVLLDVENFCKFIDYGNLFMNGIHIFTDAFEDTKKNIDKLIVMYYSGEMI